MPEEHFLAVTDQIFSSGFLTTLYFSFSLKKTKQNKNKETHKCVSWW